MTASRPPSPLDRAGSRAALGALETGSLAVFVHARLSGLDALVYGEDPALRAIQRVVAERLYVPSRGGQLMSPLVQSCQRTMDGRVYRFHLRDGLKFHSGDDLTADDVVQALIRPFAPVRGAPGVSGGPQLTPLAAFLAEAGEDPAVALAGIDVVSRTRFEVRLKRPVDDFFSLLSLAGNSLLARGGGSSESWSGLYAPDYEWRGVGPLHLTLHPAHPRAAEAHFRRIDVYQLPQDEAWLAALSPLAPVVVLGTGRVTLPADVEPGFTGRWARLPYGWTLVGRGESPQAGLAFRNAVHHVLAGRSGTGWEPAQDAAMPPRSRRRVDESGSAGAPVPHPVLARSPVPVGLGGAVELAKAASGKVPAGPGADAGAGEGALTLDWHAGPQSDDPFGVAVRLLGVSPPVAGRAGRRSTYGGGTGSMETLLGRRDVAAFRLAVAQALDDAQRQGTLVSLVQARVAVTANDSVALAPFIAAGDAGDLADIGRADGDQAGRVRVGRFAAGLGAAVQMFAHDVRRPFSMVRIIMDSLASARSLDEARETCARLLPEVDATLRVVDGMLADILEAGSDRDPLVERVSFAAVGEAALADAVAAKPRDDVRLEYALAHTRRLEVEAAKVRRALANVITNALEAMAGPGTVAFGTSDVDLDGRPAVLVTVANDGSAIAPDRVQQIFEPGYTEGKRGGTGLGLAIARKIVEGHGGRIWCRSDPVARCVAFHLLLPAVYDGTTPPPPEVWEDPPKDTAQVRTRLAASRTSSAAGGAGSSVLARLSACGPLALLVIDDETDYAEFVASQSRRLVDSAGGGEGALDVRCVNNADGALIAVAEGDFDLVICDIDLRATSQIDGFEVARRLRASGYEGKLCLHSNRVDASTYVDAVRVGADAFLPKPMSAEHLARFLADAAEARGRSAPARARPGASDPASRRLASRGQPAALIVVVDDDPFMRDAWTRAATDAEVRVFEHPGALLEALAKDPALATKASAVVLDWYFEHGPYDTAAEALAEVRAAMPKTRVFLSTDAATAVGAPRLEKRPYSWAELCGV
jgi:signal transduction histidine kinase/DNA-binding NarL/FixJ family response regulator